MQNRLFLALVTLIATTLACDERIGFDIPLPFFDTSDTSAITSVNKVEVIPAMGSGCFTLIVTYTAYITKDSKFDPIICWYVTPFGGTITIGSFTPEPGIAKTHSGLTTLTQNLSMNVTEPGLYTATCEESGGGKSSGFFGVTEKPKNPPDQGQNKPAPPAISQPPLAQEQVAFTMNGTFTLDWPANTGNNPPESTGGGIQIKVDPKTGLATGELHGNGNGTMVVTGADLVQTTQWNYSYDVLDLTGSIDPVTGAIMLQGTAQAKYNWAASCGNHCLSISPEGQFPVKITGTINLANHTGKGVVDATQNPDYPYHGEWQTAP